jgi:hypothetical protein
MGDNKDRIRRMPISWHTRLKNELGKGAVPCLVSGRWLKFPSESGGFFKEGEYIVLNVMTTDANDKDRKLCELVVTREDLLDAINSVKAPSTEKA